MAACSVTKNGLRQIAFAGNFLKLGFEILLKINQVFWENFHQLQIPFLLKIDSPTDVLQVVFLNCGLQSNLK